MTKPDRKKKLFFAMLPMAFVIGSIVFSQTAFAQWTTYNSSNSPLPVDEVRCIYVDENNKKWIGTDFGLAVYDDSLWTIYNTLNSPLQDNGIRSLNKDKLGNMWIGTFDGGVAKFDGTNWEVFTPFNSPLPSSYIRSIAFDSSGAKWFATTNGLVKYDDINWQQWDINNSILISNHLTSIAIGADDTKYIGSLNGGMIYLDDSGMTIYSLFTSTLPDNSVLHITLDTAGNRWAAMPAAGIIGHYGGTVFRWYALINSNIPSEAINHIYVDKNDMKYIGSQQKGLIVFDGTNFTNFNTLNSPIPDDYVLTSAKDTNGIVWIGTLGGLARFDENFGNGISPDENILNFSIFPNPVKKGQAIYFNNFLGGDFSARMLDMTGRNHVIQKTSGTSIQIPGEVSRGIYILQLSSGTYNFYTKVLVAD